MLQPVMAKGKIIVELPTCHKIREFHLEQRKTLPSNFFELNTEKTIL